MLGANEGQQAEHAPETFAGRLPSKTKMRAYQIDPRPLSKSTKPVRNRAYRLFIASQPCAACGQNWRIEAAHTGPHAHSQKACDLKCIPLCQSDHQTGKYALDKIGSEAFERHFGISIEKTIRALLVRAEAAGITLVPSAKKGMGKARYSTYRRRVA
jgi:hypothetical protein